MTSAGYAIKYQNIHTIRSFAKDFGLCGFKVGFLVSSNKLITEKFEEWKPIMSHHDITISVIN